MEEELTEEQLEEVYNWIDEIPLSRPKKNMARDFSDAGKFLPSCSPIRGGH
jgi:hypothetical protein